MTTLALTLGAVTAFPAMGFDSATVNATVSTPGLCITTQETQVDFGIHPFRDGGSGEHDTASQVTVVDCSGATADLLVSGTDPVGLTSARWFLTDDPEPCAIGPDNLRVEATGSTSAQNLNPNTNRLIGLVPANGVEIVSLKLWMPCQGSTGSGEAMGFDINFLVTIP